MSRRLMLALITVLMVSACGGGREYKPSPLHLRTNEQFKLADKNGDEKLTREEFAQGFPQFAANFDDVDVDRNGFVNLAELQSYFEWVQLVSRTPEDRKSKPRPQQPH
jgi:Ca2+-binding EF-hand superfamily protein